nr:immunoglobulin heavy chain junction region [Macaca mulatta]
CTRASTLASDLFDFW